MSDDNLKIELIDLNHRLLIEKIKDDLRSLEKNIDILYVSGTEKTIRYTNAIAKIAEDIEKINDSAYSSALHEVIVDRESLQGIVSIEPQKSTSASEIYERYL